MISKASSVVDAALISCEKVAYVKSVIDSIVKLVNDLLHVPTCGHANNGNLLDDTDRIRDISPTRLMEQVPYLFSLTNSFIDFRKFILVLHTQISPMVIHHTILIKIVAL